MKFISSLLQKFHQNSGSPQESHPTKIQLKESLPHTKIILSNTWPALLLCTFSKIQSFRVLQCRFSSGTCHRSTVRPGALRSASPPWPEHRTPPWTGTGVGGGEHRRSWQLLRWQSHPWRPTGDSASSQRRSAPPNAPLSSAWPHARQRTPQHHRRGPTGTGRALWR